MGVGKNQFTCEKSDGQTNIYFSAGGQRLDIISMKIEFVCDSTIDFDAATGRSKVCDHCFSVDNEKAGEIIECPKCENFVAVPDHKPAAKTSHRVRQAPHKNIQLDQSPLESPELLAEDLPEVVTEGKLDYQQLDSYQYCKHCGAALDPTLPDCPSCGAPRKASWAEDGPLTDIEHQPAGFQRWLLSLVAAEQTGPNIMILVNALLGFMGVVAVGGALFIRDLLTVVLLILIGLVGFAYWRFFSQTCRIGREQPPKLVAWQKFGWSMILHWLRIFSWKVPTSQLQHPVVVDLRGQDLSDTDLASLKNVNKADVIELDGVPIGDAGIRYLRGLQNLKYLVLRNTRVSDEAVYRLQQTIPRCWIWH